MLTPRGRQCQEGHNVSGIQQSYSVICFSILFQIPFHYRLQNTEYSSLCCRSLFILYTVYVSLLHCIHLTLTLGIFSHPQTEGLDSNLSFVKVIKEGRSSTRCVALSLGF